MKRWKVSLITLALVVAVLLVGFILRKVEDSKTSSQTPKAFQLSSKSKLM